MQITPAPPLPPSSTALTQPQAVQSALPQFQAQAVAPISQNAITPSPKSEKGDKSRRRSSRNEERGADKRDEGRGGNVNISV